MERLYAAMFALCLIVVGMAWTAEAREKALLERISVLARENQGLEARITRDALRAYCKVECGSCISSADIYNAFTNRGRGD